MTKDYEDSYEDLEEGVTTSNEADGIIEVRFENGITSVPTEDLNDVLLSEEVSTIDYLLTV